MPDDTYATDLVLRARTGDAAAWREIVERFAPLVRGVCGGYRLSGADADDTYQNIWMRTLEHLDDLRDPLSLPGWILTTARRECQRTTRDMRARQQRQTTADDELADVGTTDSTAEENVMRAERDAVLGLAFEQLSAPCQQLLLLLVADPPLSYDEIAARLSRPRGTIGPTRARCLDRLRRTEPLSTFIAEAGTQLERNSRGGRRVVD